MQPIVDRKLAKYGDNMSIGERIISLRKELNMSQGQLAQAMEVSRQAVSKWENDLAAPDSLKMIRLAEVLAARLLIVQRNLLVLVPAVTGIGHLREVVAVVASYLCHKLKGVCLCKYTYLF